MTTQQQQIADRAAELIGEAHRLPESYAALEAKHAEAMSALDRMTDQRDQLAARLKDAEEIIEEAAELLKQVEGLMDAVPTRLQHHEDETLAGIGAIVNGAQGGNGLYHLVRDFVTKLVMRAAEGQ